MKIKTLLKLINKIEQEKINDYRILFYKFDGEEGNFINRAISLNLLPLNTTYKYINRLSYDNGFNSIFSSNIQPKKFNKITIQGDFGGFVTEIYDKAIIIHKKEISNSFNILRNKITLNFAQKILLKLGF